MNGSEAIVRTLLKNDVSVCFANPGTSEMHFVSALDRFPQMRCVLGLFEGVVTGAADGYFRMLGKPASTLLHLGPGLANGIANLHNAKRARSGIVNIIGQHARDHIANDAPLTSDIEGLARPVSHWIRSYAAPCTVVDDTLAALEQASNPSPKIASLILPADVAWLETDAPIATLQHARHQGKASGKVVDEIAAVLNALNSPAGSVALLLGGRAMQGDGPRLAGQIAARTGCKLLAETKNARSERGAGRVNIPQIPYPINGAIDALRDIKHIVLVDAAKPVAFFAYPGKPKFLVQPDCSVYTLATPEEDVIDALLALNEQVKGDASRVAYVGSAPSSVDWRQGAPTSEKIGHALAALLPENAIMVDEAITTGRQLQSACANANPHDWLEITGGAIGYGLPCAVGAAVACPDRKVVAVIGDGSAMFTLQSLWTMAREGLDVTVIICANRKYQILGGELSAMGGPAPGVNARRMLTLDEPDLDWVSLARGHGVPASLAQDMGGLVKALQAAFASQGPKLIELII